MKCWRCGIKVKKFINPREWDYMMNEGRKTTKGINKKEVRHICSRCNK